MNHKITVAIDGKEVVLCATRSGFAHLASVCSRLAALTDDELATPANHFHFMAEMNNATTDSMPFALQATPDDALSLNSLND